MRLSANATTAGIDAEVVLRKARARRVPKQLAVSSLSVLAVAGVFVLGITALPTLLHGQGGASDAGMMATAPEYPQDGAVGGAESKLIKGNETNSNLCGMPTTTAAPNAAGLTLSLSFPDSSPAAGEEIAGTVALINSGTTRVSGTTAISPTIIVSRDGITVWHSHGAMITEVAEVSLDPGESYFYDAYFTPVECEPEDEADGQFRDNLPLLAAGTYELSAKLTFVSNVGTAGESILVGSQAAPIELR